MQHKIANTITVLLLLILFSCSATRKGTTPQGNVADKLSAIKILEISKGNNIAGNGYFIKKGKISIESKAFSGQFDFYAKVNSDKNFVISCKGPLEIEMLRVYGVGDSAYIIDRINRKIYSGSKNRLWKKYKLPEKFFDYLIGDIPSNAVLDAGGSANDAAFSVSYDDNQYQTITLVSKSLLKAEETRIYETGISPVVSFIYSKFKSQDNYTFPEVISIDSESLMFHVEMEIESFDAAVNEPINVKLPDYKIVGI